MHESEVAGLIRWDVPVKQVQSAEAKEPAAEYYLRTIGVEGAHVVSIKRPHQRPRAIRCLHREGLLP
jgi:hypothetical protein